VVGAKARRIRGRVDGRAGQQSGLIQGLYDGVKKLQRSDEVI
jgi:hypothetical protein